MSYIMPALIGSLIIYALIKRVDIYEAFTSGAKKALPMMALILPAMVAMMAGLTALRETGALAAFTRLISPAMERLGMDAELVPLFVLRPFSGSAAMSLLEDVLVSEGADSRTGLAASIMLGSTETIFYTVALYFGSIGVKKTRVTVPAALLAGIAGAWASLVYVSFIA